MESKYSARADSDTHVDGRLFRIEGNAPDSKAKHQPASGRYPSSPVPVCLTPDSTRHSVGQHHTGRGHWKFHLQRSLGYCESAAWTRPSVERLLHILEVARL